MRYARPDVDYINAVRILYYNWYLPQLTLYGWSLELSERWQARLVKLREEYATDSP